MVDEYGQLVMDEFFFHLRKSLLQISLQDMILGITPALLSIQPTM